MAKKSPMLTAGATGGVICTTGDVVAQAFLFKLSTSRAQLRPLGVPAWQSTVDRDKPWDLRRTASVAVFGVLMNGLGNQFVLRGAFHNIGDRTFLEDSPILLQPPQVTSGCLQRPRAAVRQEQQCPS